MPQRQDYELNVLTAAAARELSALADCQPEDIDYTVSLALDGLPSDWRQLGACRDSAAEFFPERGASAREAKVVCAECPVRSACLASALRHNEKFGVWAGTSERQRRQIRRVLTREGLLGAIGEARHLVWVEPGADVPPRVVETRAAAPKLQARAHQLAAVAALCREVHGGGVAQVQMATGTGKTLVGSLLAERLGSRTTIVLVPTLQLISQTAAMWRANYPRPARYLAVCSDAGEMDIVATTSARDVSAAWHAAQLAAEDLVVFATYHSAAVVVESGIEFELAIADEAHHLAGDVDKPFAAILRGEVKARRRVYMTATPKTRSRTSKDGEVVGMDDDAFGRRVYELGLDRAIREGLIADYRIVVASVDVATFNDVRDQLDTRVDAHLLAGAIAVVRALERYGARSLISYHSRIERASEFATLVGKVAELLPSDQRPAGPGFAAWLDGGTSVRIRDRLLARLDDPVGWGVVSNAKALGEGVDLPNLDAVAIVDPKTSEVEVTQAIGRALRRSADGTKTGLVILPVLMRGEGEEDDPLASIDGRSLEIVSGALRALRAHDVRLATKLDEARREMGERTGDPAYEALGRRVAGQLLLHHRIDLDLPGGALGNLANALAFNLVRETTAEWEENFGRLLHWLRGHDRFPFQSETVSSAGGQMKLGQWLSGQRSMYARGLVPMDRCTRLEALEGWTWEPRKDNFDRNVAALRAFIELTGNVHPGQRTVHDEMPIGTFVNTMRTAYKDGAPSMTPERIARLESLPGWLWNARDNMWWVSFALLRRYVAEHGHAAPKGDEIFEDVRIGQWVMKQRQALAGKDSRRITPEQTTLLRSLTGWRDAVIEECWEENFARAQAYCRDRGRIPAQGYVAPDGTKIGAWCAKQRQFQRKLTPERIARLESLPGWFWTERLSKPVHPALEASEGRRADEAAFDVHFRELERFIAVHGHCEPRSGDLVGSTDVGRWVVRQRNKASNGELTAERRHRLESLPGWTGPRRVGRPRQNV
jgi:superfamily II DNA or RNA helicase